MKPGDLVKDLVTGECALVVDIQKNWVQIKFFDHEVLGWTQVYTSECKLEMISEGYEDESR